MEYEARIIGETDKAYVTEPVNFKFNEDLDKFIPKSAVNNWMVDEWLRKRRGLDGTLALLTPKNGNNGGGATVTNHNALSIPVEVKNEDGELDKLASEVEEEFDIDEQKENKDAFGDRAKAEEEKIKKEQGLAPKNEKQDIPEEVKVQIEEIALILEKTIERAQKSVEKIFNDKALSEHSRANLAQDIGTTIAIRILRGY